MGVSRVGVALDQEVKEFLDVGAEGGDGTARNEAVDVHIAVHTIPELPGASADVDRVELCSNRADASIAGEPRVISTVNQKGHSDKEIELKISHQIISS